MASFYQKTGLQPQVLTFEEGAGTQTFKVGDLVVSDSSGQVVIATAGNILGIARDDATGTTASAIRVELINGYDIYSVPIGSATATAQTNVGAGGDIVFTAGGQYIDIHTTTQEVYVVGFDDALGTTGGRLLVRFYMDHIEAR
jgi:hypothetical protein